MSTPFCFIRKNDSACRPQEALRRVEKLSWHNIHKRKRTPLYTSLMWEGSTKRYYPALRFPYTVENVLYLDTRIAIAEKDWAIMRQRIHRALQKNPRFLFTLLRRSYIVNRKIEVWARRMQHFRYTNVSHKTLLPFWEWYIRQNFMFGAFLLLPLYIEQDLEERLQHVLQKHDRQSTDRDFQLFTTPIRSCVAQEEEQSLLHLAIREARGCLTQAQVVRHAERFGWIKNNSFDGVFETPAEVLFRIRRAARKDPIQRRAVSTQRIIALRRTFLQRRHHFAQQRKALSLIDTLQEAIYFRSWRTERYYRNAYFLQEFFSRTAELLGLCTATDLFYAVPQEITVALRSGTFLEEKVLRERRNGYMILADAYHEWVLSGPTVQKAVAKFHLDVPSFVRELHGHTAYPGIRRGRVCVVRTKAELAKVRRGDILVTDSTTPDYVSILRKVRAVVTEEGGVLSHASVITRELHIPCIIGTKIATRIFHNGDRVEVDAKKGIVRKL